MNAISSSRLCAVSGLAAALLAASVTAQPGTTAPAKPQPGAAHPQPAHPQPAQPGSKPITLPSGEQPTPPPPPPAREAAVAKWTDPDLQKVGEMLTGFWKSTKDVPLGDGTGATPVVMNVAPVAIKGLDNAMLAEIARADSLQSPYRVAVYQLYKHNGKVRLRTYNFHRNPDGTEPVALKALAGMTYIPQWFPSELNREWLLGTLDIELSADGAGYKGKTPYPYPTAIGGAVELTSEITIAKDALTTTDRGTDASGKVVWGDKDGSVSWARTASPVAVKTLPDGLIVIEYKKGEGKLIEEKDQVAAHYSGWLGANMKQFDSSRIRMQPLRFNQGMLIKGWNVGLLGYGKGAQVRLFIPPAQAYGERGRNQIPGNADLFFEVEIMNVEPPAAPATPAIAPAGPDAKAAEEKKAAESGK